MSDPTGPNDLAGQHHLPDASLLARLERLERTVAELTAEVRELRGAGAPREHRAPAGAPAAREPEPVHPWRPRRAAAWTAEEVEGVVGRYGMLVLATVTGLAAVGTFLGWAISQGMLGPRVRVALGFLLAAALAATGARIRPRERSFGAALLGIALAVVHVCGWGISPAGLGMVSASAALALTVTASAALAIFAHGEEDEPLWCVGFGGAAVAPFVTGGGQGAVAMLALYGGAVLLLGSWALRRREWPIAGRVLTASVALFVGALLAASHRTGAPLMALALPMVVAGAGVLPFAAPHQLRGRLRTLGALAAIAAIAAAESRTLPVGTIGVVAAIAAAAITWLAILDWSAELPAGGVFEGILGEVSPAANDWVDAAAIPLAFFVAILDPLPSGRQEALAAALAVGAFAAFVARRPAGALRDGSVFALCVAAVIATWQGGETLGRWQVVPLAGLAVLFAVGNRWRAAWPWVAAAGAALVVCTLAAFAVLADRIAYAYTPFATRESAFAAAVAAAWFAVARLLRDGEAEAAAMGAESPAPSRFRPGGVPLATVIAWGWAFLWVHQELLEAFSRTASTLLVIAYYAATSVLTVWVGRTRSLPALRHLGLVLALIAAAAAARGATRLDAVWARVAGYLVTSAFLLALAWWYRRREQIAV